jgi:hypothetical protein
MTHSHSLPPAQRYCISERMNQLGRKGSSALFALFVGSLSLAILLCAGCKTAPCSEQNFSRPFDAQRVAQLGHDSYKLAREARFCAWQDLGHLSYRPTGLDWEAVYYMNRLMRQAPWIAHDVEKNPATPRCLSKVSYDIVAFDARMLKARYNPDSYTPCTDRLIEKLLQTTDEISSYYELKAPEGQSPQK